jgi:hypothetical protein
MSSADPQARLQAARARLSGELSGSALQDAPPDPPLAELAAVDGFGGLVVDSDVRLSVYLLGGWGAGHAHADGLRARAEAGGRLARTAVNGDLLLVVTVAADGDQYLLNDLCAAFAGRE